MKPTATHTATRASGAVRPSRMAMLCVFALVSLLLPAGDALGQPEAHPLEPPNRSSPRATLQTFLKSTEAAASFAVNEYLPAKSRAGFHLLREALEVPLDCLDLTGVAPALRSSTGRESGLALYEILTRLDLPDWKDIPGAALETPGAVRLKSWTVPNTEIMLVRIENGTDEGEFRFSSDSVVRAMSFYERVKHLPYLRPVPMEHLIELRIAGGGWMIPHARIMALPEWLREPVAGQATWKWCGLLAVLLANLIGVYVVLWISRWGANGRPFLRALAGLVLPIALFVSAFVTAYILLVQVNMVGRMASVIEIVATGIAYLAGAWFCWRAASVFAEAVIASPHISAESVDAHLIRVFARLGGMVAGAALVAKCADHLGLPLYGIVAGLGVGGLAIALAAQPTIENLIGGFSLFADKPVRVGEFGQYGDALGTVESIGLRSTRIRGIDSTVTTFPNAALSKMPIVSFAARHRMLIRTQIGVRYETGSDQMRHLLVKLREMLLAHPRIDPDPARARFVGFGASSLDIEIFAYVKTNDWSELLRVREDVFLRIIDIVEGSGASIAFPSQTLYMARDPGPDREKARAAVIEVDQWMAADQCAMPDFSPEQIERIQDSIAYPPPGSPQAAKAGPAGETSSPSTP